MKHVYIPDFKVGEEFIEIKGGQFFDKDGNMKCPYRPKSWTDDRYEFECGKYRSKHRCMLENGVKILKEGDYMKYIRYVEGKYGKKYLSQFKNKSKSISDELQQA